MRQQVETTKKVVNTTNIIHETDNEAVLNERPFLFSIIKGTFKLN